MNLPILKGILPICELNLTDHPRKEMPMPPKNVLMFYKCDLLLAVKSRWGKDTELSKTCRLTVLFNAYWKEFTVLLYKGPLSLYTWIGSTLSSKHIYAFVIVQNSQWLSKRAWIIFLDIIKKLFKFVILWIMFRVRGH